MNPETTSFSIDSEVTIFPWEYDAIVRQQKLKHLTELMLRVVQDEFWTMEKVDGRHVFTAQLHILTPGEYERLNTPDGRPV